MEMKQTKKYVNVKRKEKKKMNRGNSNSEYTMIALGYLT